MQQLQQHTSNPENINLKPYWTRILKNWYLFPLGFIICTSLGIAIYRYSNPVYEIRATLIIKDKNINNHESGIPLLQDINAFSFTKNINNEITILKSDALINKTLNELNFGVSYFKNGIIRDIEVFPQPPIRVVIDTNHLQLLETAFFINIIDENSFNIHFSAKNIYPKNLFNNAPKQEKIEKITYQAKHFFGERITDKYFSFQIMKEDEFGFKNTSKDFNKFFFIINDRKKQILAYQKTLKIEPVQKDASILELTLEAVNSEKEILFLNTLCKEFIKKGLEEKNETANNIIKFIDQQVSYVSDSLNKDEVQLELFRNTDQIMDIDQSIEQLSQKLENLEKQKADLVIKDKYYQYLLKYATENEELDKLIAPATMGIDEPLLHSLIQEANKITQEKAALSISAGVNNPNLKMIELRLANSRKSIIENVNAIIQTSQIALNEVNQQIISHRNRVSKLPNAEKELSQIKRKYTHNDYVYNYLMERRAAASIAKASNTPDNKILDQANLKYENPIKPNKKYFLAIILLVSLIFPSIVIILKSSLKRTIERFDELKNIISVPSFAIQKSTLKTRKKKEKSSIQKTSSDILKICFHSEQILSHTHPKMLGFTDFGSPQKTYTTIFKIAHQLSQNHKTLIINTDVYQTHQYPESIKFKPSSTKFNQLIPKPNLVWEAITKTQYENLDIIESGEETENHYLNLKNNFKSLIQEIQSHYHYIILLCPSFISHADYLVMKEELKINCFITQESFTPQKEVLAINQFVLQNDLNNPIVIYQNA